ncbi:LysM domain containing protein [Trema orientale]|uniref:LysM domain containing protein n=1 Tax=Trema orientale TaxID=63057 RepID=A0A2P5FFE3_TREOI|nr:LysM domain containing protein [Trema orientale]
MSDSQSGAGADDAKDNTVAKTAGFVVFSGIALSILKALIPLNKKRSETQQPLTESTQPIQIPSQPYPPREPAVKKPVTYMDQNAPKAPESSQRRIEIVKGDTLWGLSKKYGVSIDAIKEANGLTGNTIYAGKKLIIP